MSASVGVARFAAAALVWLCLSLPALADGNEAVGAALAKLVKFGEFATGSVLANRERDRLIEFYAARGYKPIWARDDGPKGKARALLGELKISGVHGLSPQFYHVDEIGPLMASRQPAELARFDLLMTGALIEFGEDLANGRVGPATAGSENAVAPVAFDPVALLSGAEESGNLRSVVGGELNTDFRYIRLIAKLAELQRIAKRNLWPQIGDGGEIAAKAHDPRIPAIRKMLALDGDLPIALAGSAAMRSMPNCPGQLASIRRATAWRKPAMSMRPLLPNCACRSTPASARSRSTWSAGDGRTAISAPTMSM